MNSKAGTFDSISGALSQLEPLLAKITQASSLQELAHSIYDVLKKDFDFKSTGFYFVNPESKKLELLLAEGLTADEIEEAEATAMERHPGWVILNQKTYLSNLDTHEPTDFQKRLHLVSRLYCPVIFRGQCIGTIGVASEESNAFSENHIAFIEFLCRIAAVTYENIIHALEARRNRERMDQAIAALKFGIWDWDIEHNLLYWDDYMYQLYERDPKDFSGSYDAFEKTLHPEDAGKVQGALESCSRNQSDFQTEFRVMTSSGKIKRIAASAKSTFSKSGKLIRLVGANWDITELRENEMRLLHASKMSSLGEMSSGIAHEINNPLAIIHGKSHQIRRHLSALSTPESAPLVKLTEDIDQTVERISKIIKGLRSFSREGEKDPFELRSVKTLVDETLAFCATRFKHHEIELKVGKIGESLTLQCRPSQIAQVLLNLLNNAYDAVQNLPDRWVAIEATDRGQFIDLLITDSGSGIPEKIRERMMDPFFTTKEVGKGTGLGLSISLGILKSHQGSLLIDPSHPNTRFVIQLPKLQNPSIKAPSLE